MVGILIVSHGKLAEALISSEEMSRLAKKSGRRSIALAKKVIKRGR